MNAAIVSRMLSVIPDRVARAQSGSLFDPNAQGACAHPERITHLAQFLNWLGPLREVTKDDLRILGLLTQYGKPAIDNALDEEGELDAALDAEPALEPELEPQLIEPSLPAVSLPAQEPALT
jgi:hypothetical protein